MSDYARRTKRCGKSNEPDSISAAHGGRFLGVSDAPTNSPCPGCEMILAEIKALRAELNANGGGRGVQEWYTTAEAAAELGKAPFTVRQWCLRGRIRSVKAESGRGAAGEYRISIDEIKRYRNEGLLPEPRYRS